MTHPKSDEPSASAAHGDVTRVTADGTMFESVDLAASVMPEVDEMPRGSESMTLASQSHGGEMPRGAMERASTTPRGGAGTVSGIDMTVGANAGDGMPRGDSQRLTSGATSEGASDGEMPRGRMEDAGGEAGTMPGGENQGTWAMPRSGMKITGSWTFTVSGVTLET